MPTCQSPGTGLCLSVCHVVSKVIASAASSPLAVFDGVFEQTAQFSVLWPNKGRHAYFERGAIGTQEKNVLEEGINSFLTAIGDESPTVEYWRRPTWSAIGLHRDLDEGALERGSANGAPPRHPINGHVLYLAVGTGV